MRTWIFEETGEVRVPRGDYICLNDKPEFVFLNELQGKYPILKLTEYPENPLGPIQEVWEKLSFVPIEEQFKAMYQAIQKCMKIAGEGR